jgi:hypothetical protein
MRQRIDSHEAATGSILELAVGMNILIELCITDFQLRLH